MDNRLGIQANHAATETRRGKFQTTNFSSPTRISFAP
jgi:hypothetical protein